MTIRIRTRCPDIRGMTKEYVGRRGIVLQKKASHQGVFPANEHLGLSCHGAGKVDLDSEHLQFICG